VSVVAKKILYAGPKSARNILANLVRTRPDVKLNMKLRLMQEHSASLPLPVFGNLMKALGQWAPGLRSRRFGWSRSLQAKLL